MKALKKSLVLLTLLAATQVNAQVAAIQVNALSPIQSFESTVYYDEGQRPCIQVNLDPEPKTLKEAWREYLKDNYNFKLKGIGFLSNKDLLSAEAIMVDQISSKEMDFFTHISEDVNGSEMKVFVRYGYDIYLTKEKNPVDYEALQEILDSFLKYYLPIYYEGRVNDTENRIIKLTEETIDLRDNIEDDAAKIAKLKMEIENLEKDLESNNEMLATAELKLVKRTEKLDRIRNLLRKM